MNDTMKGLKKTHYCGEVPNDEQEVVVCGFTDRVRDMGNLIFINLRDRTGLVQLTFNDETDGEIFAKAQTVRGEIYDKNNRLCPYNNCFFNNYCFYM